MVLPSGLVMFLVIVAVVVLIVIIKSAGSPRHFGAGGDHRTCRGCGASHPGFAVFCRRCGRRL